MHQSWYEKIILIETSQISRKGANALSNTTTKITKHTKNKDIKRPNENSPSLWPLCP